jgi:hypothetical protein
MPVRGERTNQCPTCHLFFFSLTAFDKHRTGDHGRNRRCRTPDEMLEKGMCLNKDGYWVSEKMTEEKRERFKSNNKALSKDNG